MKKEVKKRTVEIDPGLFLIKPAEAIALVLEPFSEDERLRLRNDAKAHIIEDGRGSKSSEGKGRRTFRRCRNIFDVRRASRMGWRSDNNRRHPRVRHRPQVWEAGITSTGRASRSAPFFLGRVFIRFSPSTNSRS